MLCRQLLYCIVWGIMTIITHNHRRPNYTGHVSDNVTFQKYFQSEVGQTPTCRAQRYTGLTVYPEAHGHGGMRNICYFFGSTAIKLHKGLLKQAKRLHLVLLPLLSSACLKSFWGNPRFPQSTLWKILEQMLSLLPASPVILWIYDLAGSNSSESFKTESEHWGVFTMP